MTSDEAPAREILSYVRNLSTVNVEFYTGVGHVAEARTAVIYEKPWTVIHAERWIDFPWSSTPPLVDRRGGLAH